MTGCDEQRKILVRLILVVILLHRSVGVYPELSKKLLLKIINECVLPVLDIITGSVAHVFAVKVNLNGIKLC